MFYPELSPAMRWQLEQHQKMYSMYHSMESGKMALGDQYGEIGMDGMIILWMFVIVVLIIIPAICLIPPGEGVSQTQNPFLTLM